MENKQIEELAEEAYPIKEARNELQRTITKGQQYGFIAGYQSAMPKWVSIKDRLPTDNSVKYFIAKNGFYHNNLYRLNEILNQHADIGITHYMPFVIPTPPQT